MENKMIDKNELLEQLAHGPVNVTFLKTDGTQREMRCTRDVSLITVQYERKTDGLVKAENPDVCNVFDLDKEAWRSFRWASVQRWFV